MPPADADAARHALTRLALAHPADLDRWAGAVGAALGLTPAVARGVARGVAVEGDGRETRCAVLARYGVILRPRPLPPQTCRNQ